MKVINFLRDNWVKILVAAFFITIGYLVMPLGIIFLGVGAIILTA